MLNGGVPNNKLTLFQLVTVIVTLKSNNLVLTTSNEVDNQNWEIQSHHIFIQNYSLSCYKYCNSIDHYPA